MITIANSWAKGEPDDWSCCVGCVTGPSCCHGCGTARQTLCWTWLSCRQPCHRWRAQVFICSCLRQGWLPALRLLLEVSHCWCCHWWWCSCFLCCVFIYSWSARLTTYLEATVRGGCVFMYISLSLAYHLSLGHCQRWVCLHVHWSQLGLSPVLRPLLEVVVSLGTLVEARPAPPPPPPALRLASEMSHCWCCWCCVFMYSCTSLRLQLEVRWVVAVATGVVVSSSTAVSSRLTTCLMAAVRGVSFLVLCLHLQLSQLGLPPALWL